VQLIVNERLEGESRAAVGRCHRASGTTPGGVSCRKTRSMTAKGAIPYVIPQKWWNTVLLRGESAPDQSMTFLARRLSVRDIENAFGDAGGTPGDLHQLQRIWPDRVLALIVGRTSGETSDVISRC
jgi:hypothetical protein